MRPNSKLTMLTQENELAVIFQGIKQGEMTAIIQFLNQYHKRVYRVAYDVLRDDERASASMRWTVKNAVRQLQMGLATDTPEEWLMWLSRSDALIVSQILPQHFLKEPEITQTQREPNLEPIKNEAPPPIVLQDVLSRKGILREVPQKVQAKPETLESSALEDAIAAATIAATATVAVPTAPAEVKEKTAATFITEDEKKEAPARAYDFLPYKQPGAEKNSKKGMIADVVLLAGIIIVILALIWVVLGLLGKNNVISLPDLGYGWFNEKMFRMF